MNNWTYEGEDMIDISQFPEDVVGFVYEIRNTITGKFYIGKKNVQSIRTKALTKKELALQTDKRASKKKKITAESDWKTYHGSEQELKKDIKLYGESHFYRKILHLCSSKASLTYQEVRYQILNGVLESENCYNGQILGKFWKTAAI